LKLKKLFKNKYLEEISNAMIPALSEWAGRYQLNWIELRDVE